MMIPQTAAQRSGAISPFFGNRLPKGSTRLKGEDVACRDDLCLRVTGACRGLCFVQNEEQHLLTCSRVLSPVRHTWWRQIQEAIRHAELTPSSG
jgi:hypothetical protein